jgi:hypothetical protein
MGRAVLRGVLNPVGRCGGQAKKKAWPWRVAARRKARPGRSCPELSRHIAYFPRLPGECQHQLVPESWFTTNAPRSE